MLRSIDDRPSAGDLGMPHDLEAEKAVLGAILINPGAFTVAVQAIGADDFFRHAHRLIYRAMVALDASQTPIDLLLLKQQLGRTGDLDEVGGPVYIAALADGVPHSTN